MFSQSLYSTWNRSGREKEGLTKRKLLQRGSSKTIRRALVPNEEYKKTIHSFNVTIMPDFHSSTNLYPFLNEEMSTISNITGYPRLKFQERKTIRSAITQANSKWHW